jgi:catechol 2,3-dioxygenase-like lactoylglutathione lyase family enzyme
MSANPFPRMHVSLYVSNIYQTADFYTKFFGQNPDKIKPDYAKFTLENPSLIISFVQNPEKVNSEFGHLGMQVETLELLEQRLSTMKTKAVPVLEEMGTNCCYATQDKFWVSDPDGHMWEVYYFHQDVEFNDPRFASQEANACCSPASVNEQPIASTQEAKPKISLSTLGANNDSSCDPNSGCC